MAYTTINKSTDYFDTKLYSGNASTQSITGINFQPDLIWGKARDAAETHDLVDAVRGNTKYLATPSNSAETTASNGVTSFNSDGFSLGARTSLNGSGMTFATWNWKAGTTSIPTGSTSDPSAVSINATSGFGIYKITAPGSGNYVLKHGLGATPAMVIVKRTDGTQGWMVWHNTFSNATDDYIQFNTDAAKGTYSSCWGTMNSTDCTIATGGTLDVNGEHIIYVFTKVTGYSKFGAYTHNGASGDTGTFVNLGFKPSFLMIKNTSAASTDWIMYDSTRSPMNSVDDCLFPNESSAESVNYNMTFLSNGFKLNGSGPAMGSSGNVVIYAAFGQSLVGSNDVPCTGF